MQSEAASGWVSWSPSSTNANTGWANANPHATGGVGGNIGGPSAIERARAHVDLKVTKNNGLGFNFEFRIRKGVECAFVVDTNAGTEAAKLGIQPGMFIERINGMDMGMLTRDQIDNMLQFQDGNKLSVRFKRD